MKPVDLKKLVVHTLEEQQGIDIVALDVRTLTSITDFMIICTGRSNRHVKSLADGVVEKAKEQGVRALSIEGTGTGEWVLVDLVDVVVHLMQPKAREFYDLEKLWTSFEK
ncbi:MAG: ribosome silencing factor [Proteobacteria bacterium]|nr:ribosome silencing factor [Pseudomonadota bacterium]